MRAIFIALVITLATHAHSHHELANRNLENGFNNYQEYCASCHGVNLEGQANWRSQNQDGTLAAPPHDETGHTWHHETEMLFEYTKLGGQVTLEAVGVKNFTSGMPAFGDVLTDEQIWEVLSYIRSTWPQHIQDAHATRHPTP
jgi:mono/diheme cytochrome c family protein